MEWPTEWKSCTSSFDRVAWWTVSPKPRCFGVNLRPLDATNTISWQILNTRVFRSVSASFSSSWDPVHNSETNINKLFGTKSSALSWLMLPIQPWAGADFTSWWTLSATRYSQLNSSTSKSMSSRALFLSSSSHDSFPACNCWFGSVSS